MPLEQEDRLEEDDVSDANLELTSLDLSDVGCGARRLMRIVVKKVAQQYVRIQELLRHLPSGPLNDLVDPGLLSCLAELLGGQGG